MHLGLTTDDLVERLREAAEPADTYEPATGTEDKA